MAINTSSGNSFVLISTIIRESLLGSPSGRLLVYDLKAHKLIKECQFFEPDYINENTNPRGGIRGVRGMSGRHGLFAIANGSSVYCFNDKWQLLYKVFHPSIANCHDILLDEDSIWITSTKNDLLAQIDFNNRIITHFDVRKFRSIMPNKKWNPKIFLNNRIISEGLINFRDPRTMKEAYSDSSHLNSVIRLADSSMLISLGLQKKTGQYFLAAIKAELQKIGIWQKMVVADNNIQNAIGNHKIDNSLGLFIQVSHGQTSIFQIDPNGMIKLMFKFTGTSHPGHSLRQLHDGTVIYSLTSTGELVHFDPDECRLINKIKVGERFLRGSLELPDYCLLLGDHCDLITFNLAKKEVESRIPVTDNRKEAIYDIHLLPEGFSLPPASFIQEQSYN